MTREEAGKLLNKWGVLLPSEALDALDMAIESLKSEIGKAEHRSLWHYAESIDIVIKTLKKEEYNDETRKT